MSSRAHSGSPVQARGPLSDRLLSYLTHDGDGALIVEAAVQAAACDDIVRDDDAQLSLFLLYSLAYGSLAGFDAGLEWDITLLQARARLEDAGGRHAPLRRAQLPGDRCQCDDNETGDGTRRKPRPPPRATS